MAREAATTMVESGSQVRGGFGGLTTPDGNQGKHDDGTRNTRRTLEWSEDNSNDDASMARGRGERWVAEARHGGGSSPEMEGIIRDGLGTRRDAHKEARGFTGEEIKDGDCGQLWRGRRRRWLCDARVKGTEEPRRTQQHEFNGSGGTTGEVLMAAKWAKEHHND